MNQSLDFTLYSVKKQKKTFRVAVLWIGNALLMKDEKGQLGQVKTESGLSVEPDFSYWWGKNSKQCSKGCNFESQDHQATTPGPLRKTPNSRTPNCVYQML